MVRSPGSSCFGSKDGDGGVINNKGPWTEAEDEILSRYVKARGEGNWRLIPKLAGLSRCGKSCRLRWINYLSPNVKRGNFSVDEDNLILTLHALLGNRWSLIAGRIPGRTDNEIKNYWNTHLRRKLRTMGVDPMSYKVGLTLTNSNSNFDPSSNPCSDNPCSNSCSNPCSNPCSDPSSSTATEPDQYHDVRAEQVVSSPGDSASTSGTSFDTSEPDNMSNLLNFHSLPSSNDWGSCCDQYRLEHLQFLDPLQYPMECNRSSGMLDSSSQHDASTQWATGLFDSLLD